MLRLRRHVRGQERRHVDGDALRQAARDRSTRGAEVCTAADNSCLMHIGGGAAPPARRACGRCTSPRSWRRRMSEGARLPRGRARALRRHPAAAQPRQGDDDDPRQARARGRRAARLGGAARRGRRDQGARDGDAARAARAPRGVGARARAGRCTGRATAPRRTRSSRGIAARARRARGDQGQVARHRRDRASTTRSPREGIAGDRDRPRRADRPARRATVRRTSSCPRSTRNRAEIRRCSSARSPRGEDLGWRGRRRSPRPRAGTCARSSSRSPVAVSAARTSASPRPARSASSSPRATGACARRCPRCSSR